MSSTHLRPLVPLAVAAVALAVAVPVAAVPGWYTIQLSGAGTVATSATTPAGWSCSGITAVGSGWEVACTPPGSVDCADPWTTVNVSGLGILGAFASGNATCNGSGPVTAMCSAPLAPGATDDFCFDSASGIAIAGDFVCRAEAGGLTVTVWDIACVGYFA